MVLPNWVPFRTTRFFNKTEVYKKHETQNQAEIKKQLRNTGRLSFESKLEKSVFLRKFLIEL